MPGRNPIRSLVLLVFLTAAAASAQSITLSVSPTAVNWGNLVPGSATNPGSTSVTLTTIWNNLSPAGGGNLKVYAFFASSTAALKHSAACTVNCPDIPSSAFEIRIPSSGALTPVSGTGPFGAAGASLQLLSIAITGTNKSSSRSDPLPFNINLSTLPNLPADTYTGVLNIQAQSLP